MKATWLYRTAAILCVIFATGHTIGFLKFVPSTLEGKAVMDAMNNVHLLPNAAYTFGAFYRGFGLFVTVYLLFAAFVAWHLGELARKSPLLSARCLGYFSACSWSALCSLGNIFLGHR